MADKIIGLKLVMTGADDAVDELDMLNINLVQATQELNDFLKRAEKFRVLDGDIKKLNKSLAAMSKRLAEIKKLSNNKSLSPEEIAKLAREYDTLTGKQAKSNRTLKTNLNSLTELRRELRGALANGIENYDGLITRIAKAKAKQDELNQEIREQAKAQKANKFQKGSFRQLNQELTSLRKKYRDLSEAQREGFPGRQMLRRITELDTKVKGIDGKIGSFQRNVGNYSSAWKGVGKAMTAIAGPLGIAFAVEEIVAKLVEGIVAATTLNLKFSDSFADVRKTTNLTKEGVDELFETLAGLDTRTSLANLLDISRIGGQLGIAQDDLAGFTEVIDKLVVSLRDELGDNVEKVAGDIGKINEVFGVSSQLGVADGLNAIGSSINELGKAGTARSDFLVDFSQRLGGIAPAAKVSIQEVLGLAAAFDEGGQSAEVSSTALIQVLGLIGKDVPKFAEIAGLSVEEFGAILERSGNEGLLAVLEGAGKTEGGLAALGQTLDQFGVSGTRVSQVLGFLVNNTDLVREKQELANVAFDEGNSLTEEFNLKNETAAAEVAKLGKNIQALFIDSGFQEFLRKIVAGINDLITSSGVWREEWKEVGEALRLLFVPFRFFFGLLGKALRALGLFSEETNTATTFIKLFSKTIQLFNPFLFLLKAIGKASFAFQRLFNQFKEFSNEYLGTEFNVIDPESPERQAETMKKTREIIVGETKKTTEALKQLTDDQIKDAEAAEKAKMKAAEEATAKRLKLAEEEKKAAANIRKLDVEAISDPFEQQKAQARLDKDTAIESLVGTDAQRLAQRELIEEAFTDRLVEIEGERAAKILDERKALEEKEVEARQAELERQLEENDAAFEREKLQLIEQLKAKKDINAGRVEGGEITATEGEDADTAAEDEAKLLELEAERAHLLARAEIMEEFGLNTIAIQQTIAEREIQINDEKNAKLIDNEKKTQQQRKAVLDANLKTISGFVSDAKNFLDKDEANRKKYGAVIKALGIGEIAINLTKELSAIATAAAANPTNAVTFGAAGNAQFAIQSAIAIARAAVGTAQILKQKFEYGGAIDSSHTNTLFHHSLPQTTAGTILAPPHTSGGKTVSINGNLAELEGGELLYRNGPETYILNKRAARKFGHLVRKDKRPSKQFHADRRILAHRINTFNGWGVPMYQDGGTLNPQTFSTNISPQTAPVTGFAESLSASSFDPTELTASITAQTEATNALIVETNARIDRVQVITDPVEIVKAALASGEITIAT